MEIIKKRFIPLTLLGIVCIACTPITQTIETLAKTQADAKRNACDSVTAATNLICSMDDIPSSPDKIVAPQLRQPVFIVNPEALNLPRIAIEAAQQARLVAGVSSMKKLVFNDPQNQALERFPDQVILDGNDQNKVQFIVDATNTAGQSGSTTVLDVGAGGSTYATGYKLMNPNDTVFSIEADSRQMFRITDDLNVPMSDKFVFYTRLHTDQLQGRVQFDRVLVHNPVSESKAVADSLALVKPGGEMIIVPYKPTEGDIPNQIQLIEKRFPEIKGKIRSVEVSNYKLAELTGKGVLDMFAQQNGVELARFFHESSFSDAPPQNGTSRIIIVKK